MYYIKFGLIALMTYRTSFFIELVVEALYIFWSVFYFQVVYSNVDEIAGWTYLEVLFLLGLNIVLFELFVGVVFVWSLRLLPEKIKDGDIDVMLTKPLNSLFNLTLSRPYIASFLSMIPGFYLMIYSLVRLDVSMDTFNIFWSLIIMGCGLIIAYCLLVILTSLSFVFPNANFLPAIAIDLLEFAQNPYQVYEVGILRVLFFLLVPIVFMASIPVSTFLYGVQWQFVILGVLLALIFSYTLLEVWQSMIRRYSSASS